MAKKKDVAEVTTGGFMSLDALLRKDDKKGLFNHTSISLGMPTGFLPLDYRNGYKMKVFGNGDEVVEEYNNIGIFGGTFNTVIGKTGTAKTTLCSQMSANISRYCEKKFGKYCEIYHIDAEQASNYTRIKTITNFTIEELQQRYHLDQECTYIEDIYDKAVKICNMKEAYKDMFTIHTGIKDEFGNEIVTYVPTMLIIDSLPSIATKEGEKKDELQTGTYANRIAKAISRFYKQMMPIVKKYNLIVFVINHINKKIEIGGMPTQPQTMYLKMDESIPCGFAPLYYAHNIFKIVSAKKYKIEDDGFDGFRARVELLKSRSNKAGKFCHLVYDQEIGFDPYLSLYDYLKEDKGLIGGRNPYRFVMGYEDIKFDDRNFREAVKTTPGLYEALQHTSMVALDEILSNNKFNDTNPSPSDISHLIDSMRDSYNSDESFEENKAS